MSNPVIIVGNSAFENRSIAAAKAVALETRNRYEAAQPSNPRRSWLPAFVRDARYDANSLSRWELVRKTRYFFRNNWLMKKLCEVDVKYSVGPNGLSVIPASADHDWNKKAAAEYLKWSQAPCIDSRIPMGAVHKLIATETHVDGEIFILKTSDKSGLRGQSVPKIKLVESHRCCSPGAMGFGGSDTGSDYIDGIKLNSQGLPVAYSFIDGLEGNVWVEKDAKDVIHVGKIHRAGQPRPITEYDTSLNTLHDLDDLAIMEMDRAKEASSVSNVIKTRSGELSEDQYRQQRFGGKTLDRSIPTQDSLNERAEYYQKRTGSKTIALNLDEEIQQFNSNQPSASTQWYWKFLISQVCASRGIPMILVLPESIQGTVARGIYDDADLYFKSNFHMYAHVAKEIYLYWLSWAVYNLPALFDPPADFEQCHVIGPRAVNVDKGNTAASTLALYSAGFTNLDDIAGPQGMTGEILIRKKAASVKMINDVAAEFDIDPAQISAPIADTLQKLAIANQANAQAVATADSPEPVEA